ncbi:hypothetical protein ACQUFY_20145 [Robbsia andropogonis]|uniref:hypothetical protein n=1 Tax=Robbsia andropogonis TaxID=28092 RepID=UPI003D23ACD1
METTIVAQYPDAEHSKIVGVFGSIPDDPSAYAPAIYFAETTTSDPLYATFYNAQVEFAQKSLPTPTTTSTSSTTS